MNKCIFTVAVLALAAAMCIPLSAVADSSDAFDVTPGEAGVSWASNPLSAEQAQRLYSAEYGSGLAKSTLGMIVSDSYDFTVSNLDLSDLRLRMALGTKVTEKSLTVVNDSSYSCSLKFKAAAEYSGDDLLATGFANPELIEFVGIANQTQAGAFFEIDGTFTVSDSSINTTNVTKTDEGKYIPVGSETKAAVEVRSFAGTVKYVYDDSGAETTKEFSVDYSMNVAFHSRETFIFEGNPEKAVSDAHILTSRDYPDAVYSLTKKDTFNGKTYTVSGDASDVMKIESTATSSGTAAIMTEGAFAIPAYKYYGSAGVSLFSSVQDSTLANDDALKAFMSENGTVGDSYAAALSLAESDIVFPGSGSNLLIYAGAAVAVIAVAALAYFLFFRRRA